MSAKQKAIWFIAVLTVYVLVIFTASCKNPQPSLVVTGTVTDAKTGQPLVGAKVSDDGYGPKPYKGAITDSSGKYRYITWMEEHNVLAQADGYKPQLQTLKTSSSQTGKEKVLDFSLQRE